MLDGPSIILGNILREFRPDKLVLFRRKFSKHLEVYNKTGNRLNAKTYSIFVPSAHSSKYGGFIRRAYRVVELAAIPFSVAKGLWISFIERPSCILATSDPPHCHFMIAAYLTAKLLRKRFYLYLFDPLEGFTSSRLQRLMLQYFMPLMFKYAAQVIVMDELLAEFYKDKYGLQCEILYHSSNIRNPIISTENETIKKDIYTIMFSGNISRFQYDALLNLKYAIQLVPHKIRLLIYSPTSEKTLRETGFHGDHISIKHYDHEVLMSELVKADILFLPLSFLQSDSIIVKAAFPSKTIDYLEAQKPILIHAPADCFIVKYAKECKFAEIVSDDNIVSLARAIELLFFDKERQRELVRNSYGTLLKHDSSGKYQELMNILRMN